ncbi:MAG: hypothetical protein WEB00_12705 [Dehalococcoidia bacterium]
MAAGNLSPEMVALIWMGLDKGASIVVASDPPSSGKTTTLSALLPFFSEEALLYFTKGLGERFELPALDGRPTYLMVNEISDHLPVYSWGSHVQRIFELMGEGYALSSTMHCDSTDEVIEQLRDDIGVAEGLIGHLTFVVPLEVRWEGGVVRRRALELALLRPGEGGPQKTTLARWSEIGLRYLEPGDDELSIFAAYLEQPLETTQQDLARRVSILKELLVARAGGQQIEGAIEAFRRGDH